VYLSILVLKWMEIHRWTTNIIEIRKSYFILLYLLVFRSCVVVVVLLLTSSKMRYVHELSS